MANAVLLLRYSPARSASPQLVTAFIYVRITISGLHLRSLCRKMNSTEHFRTRERNAVLPEERRRRIIQMLREQETGTLAVSELASVFDVSDMTIRRDLAWLEGRALVRRVHGGAVTTQTAEPEKPFAERRGEFDEQKRGIGWTAAQLVEDGDIIILDAGTTTQQMVRHLASRRDLTVITHALPIVQELAHIPEIKTIILGGLLKPKELCAVGPTAAQQLGRLAVDKAFLSAAGFDLERGLTDPDIYEAEVKEAMIRAASRIFLTADSSKWQRVALVRFAAFQTLDILITDDALPPEAVMAIEAAGVAVLTPRRAGERSFPARQSQNHTPKELI